MGDLQCKMWVVREGLCEKLAFEQGLEGGEGISPAETGKSFPGREVTRCKLQTGALPSTGKSVWLGHRSSVTSYVDRCQQNRNLLLNEMSFDQRNKILF